VVTRIYLQLPSPLLIEFHYQISLSYYFLSVPPDVILILIFKLSTRCFFLISNKLDASK
jgi:hypothetical protein